MRKQAKNPCAPSNSIAKRLGSQPHRNWNAYIAKYVAACNIAIVGGGGGGGAAAAAAAAAAATLPL